MARPLRIEFPGAFYHVMNRGNSGMDIYTLWGTFVMGDVRAESA